MKQLSLSLTLAACGPWLCAQDAAATLPGPDDAVYEPLRALAGTWTCEVSAMGEKSTAVETSELVCNGLFLKSLVNGTWGGKPFQGLSLWGYDPKAKHYVNVWVDSSAPTAALSTGVWDAASKTLRTTTTVSPSGPSRGTTVWKDADTVVDTCWGKGADGKETVQMEIVRKRGTPPAKPSTEPTGTAHAGKAEPAAAVASAAAAYAELHRAVGRWSATIACTTPDGTPSEDRGNEANTAICGGLWVWSDFRSPSFMGQPFEGHALCGYDPASKTYTTYWVDSMSPFVTTLRGKLDEKTKTLTSEGTTYDPMGGEMKMQETTSWKDEHTRVATFTCTSGEQSMKMEITYVREQQEGAHRIK
jgi:hypothetical protein